MARDRASAYASAISELLPECVHVADRFHLLQNLLEYLKEIFKEEIPPEIFIRGGKVLNHPPEKVLREKKPDERLLAGMDYDNSVPLDGQGNEIAFDNKRRDLDSPQYTKPTRKAGKKQQLIRQIQSYRDSHKKQSLKAVAEEFQISYATAKKYLHMTESEIKQLGQTGNYKKRRTVMDSYINIIFKMMADGISDELIYFYVISKGYSGSRKSLWNYIYCIEKNNYPARTPMNPKRIMEWVCPKDVIRIRRNDLLRYLLTVNPMTKKDETIGHCIDLILDKYEAARTVREIFCSFHSILMGNDPTKLDGFLENMGNQESGLSVMESKGISPRSRTRYPMM